MTDRTFGQALGELIFRKRKVIGLTQVQLAEDAYGDAGKTRRISELESGTVANPHPKTIDPIIATLRISGEELAECVRSSVVTPEGDLDRAYREARNLIDAVAKKFEHSKPSATLAELDEFLRSKAMEWTSLRERIAAVDAPQVELLSLKDKAEIALSEGQFDQVDCFLSAAEDAYQKNVTLKEVRKIVEIRITRGDNALFRGDPQAALKYYLSAAEFFRPFDETEMATCLNDVATKVYEITRRSLEPEFFVAARLLETLVEIPSVQRNAREIAAANYRLGLIYRNEFERGSHNTAIESLDRAIFHSRQGESFLSQVGSVFEAVSATVGLANCLWQRGQRTSALSDIQEAVDILRIARSKLAGCLDASELLPHVCNSLGGALMDLQRLAARKEDPSNVDEALEAFEAGVKASEKLSNAEGWGAAKANIGELLAQKANSVAVSDSARSFLRIRAIAELSSALETFPVVMFPLQCALAHLKLKVLCEHARTILNPLTEYYLSRALDAYTAAASVFSQERHPEQWAHIQVQVGSIYAFHAKSEGVGTIRADYERSLEFYRSALPILRNGADTSAADWCEKAIRLAEIALASSNNRGE